MSRAGRRKKDKKGKGDKKLRLRSARCLPSPSRERVEQLRPLVRGVGVVCSR
jgi:hypothetical protein